MFLLFLGMRAPQRPLHLDVVVTEYNAVVNWTVPFITYTPETYVVGYRQNDSSIYHYTETLTGTVDIDAENETYEVELRGLEPATNYCLVVIARNLANFSESEEVCFNTEETGETKTKVCLIHRKYGSHFMFFLLYILTLNHFPLFSWCSYGLISEWFSHHSELGTATSKRWIHHPLRCMGQVIVRPI